MTWTQLVGFVITPVLVAILGFVSTLLFNAAMRRKRKSLLNNRPAAGKAR